MKRIIAQLIFLGDGSIELSERVESYLALIAKLAPIAFILRLFNWWITENEQFGTFVCIAILINAVVGAVTHLKLKTFNFQQMLGKNVIMIFTVCTVYIMLEMLRYTAGDNIVGEVFRILIQITTLMYPTSKVFKNVYILTDGKYPPEYIMQRLYNFEKNGDLRNFFKGDGDED